LAASLAFATSAFPSIHAAFPVRDTVIIERRNCTT
jgi:hypothetical protein